MPSPVGHALGGLIVGLATLPNGGLPPRRRGVLSRDLLICAVAACAPDVDFLWGRHAMETHSVGAAAAAGLAVYAITRRRDLAVACGLAWASHLLFDWLGSDDFPPIGIMALWPFSNEFYFAHAYLFDSISRRYALANFWTHNIMAVVKEIVLLAPIAGLLYWWRRR